MRQRQAMERSAERLCECGHPSAQHHEGQPTFTVIDGEYVETRHPLYEPGRFLCDAICTCTRFMVAEMGS